ncbi:MAG: deoxyribonuclease IV [candidate division WS1 bacterium]|nr:deoxyribonuclease IV [candidate division WS1 bacterium]
MRRAGFHISIAGGLSKVLPRAQRRNCTALQMFTSSPAQWAVKPLDAAQGAALAQSLAAADLHPHFVHAVYLLNLVSPDRVLRGKSVRHLAQELRRAETIGAAGVIFHLGSVGPQGKLAAGVPRLARSLQETRERAENVVPLILENSAGGGGSLGNQLEPIAEAVAGAASAEPLNFCLDTAHAFAAGWPLHTEQGLEGTLERLETALGLERLALLHLNDSLFGLGSHRDRHWHLGRGKLGGKALRRIVNHPRLAHLPLIMETPGTEADDRRNMRLLRKWLGEGGAKPA